MPAWITSLLRELVSVPIASAASRTITSRPASASSRATAKPTTPAPITTQSAVSAIGLACPTQLNRRMNVFPADENQGRTQAWSKRSENLTGLGGADAAPDDATSAEGGLGH